MVLYKRRGVEGTKSVVFSEVRSKKVYILNLVIKTEEGIEYPRKLRVYEYIKKK